GCTALFLLFLRIAAIRRWARNSERAAESAVAAPTSVLRPRGKTASNRRIRTHALPVIEIKQHRRTLRRGQQQLFESSQRARADHIALIGRDQISVGALIDKNVEVVEPEIGHHFL